MTDYAKMTVGQLARLIESGDFPADDRVNILAAMLAVAETKTSAIIEQKTAEQELRGLQTRIKSELTNADYIGAFNLPKDQKPFKVTFRIVEGRIVDVGVGFECHENGKANGNGNGHVGGPGRKGLPLYVRLFDKSIKKYETGIRGLRDLIPGDTGEYNRTVIERKLVKAGYVIENESSWREQEAAAEKAAGEEIAAQES